MKKTNEAAEPIDPERAKTVMEKLNTNLGQSFPDTMAKRQLCIAMICANVDPRQIKALTGVGLTTISKISKAIAKGSEDDLFVIKGGGRPSKLAKRGKDLEKQVLDMVDNENFYTYKQIIVEVDRRFGITLSPSAVSRLLRKNGYSWYKCGSLPAKADAEAQRKFYDTVLHPLMEKAEKGEIVLFFVDAAHFVIGCDFLGRVYSKSRRYIITLSGRQRHNVLAAINYVTKGVLTVENDTYIDAQCVRDLLDKIHEAYPDKEVHIILDNARYQKCSAVTDWLADHPHIVLDYLPSYSPNLNLIERLWKFVKTELRQTYYTDFNVFKAKISEIIASTQTTNYGRICKLIGEKVQLFDGLNQIDCHTLVCPKKTA